MASPSSLLGLGLIAALTSSCLSIEKKHVGSPFLVSKSQSLQKGQTKSEVLSILGAPWCIEPDPEHLSRELYIYKSRESEQRTRFFPPLLVLWKTTYYNKYDERRLTVSFENNRIVDLKYEVWGDTKLDKPSNGPQGKLPSMPIP
jgi:outer membrane protein assembly factor BamE (lipoprotein component of BamABCDE complex)